VNLLVINSAALQSDSHMIHILDHAHPVYVLYIGLDSYSYTYSGVARILCRGTGLVLYKDRK